MIYVQSQASFLTTTFYILLTIFLLTKYINCFVFDTNLIPSSQSHQTATQQQYVNFTMNDDAHTTDVIPKSDSNENSSTDEERELDVETGRRKSYKYKMGKTGKKKKYYKFLYPVLIGLLITKMIMFPLFVKAVTILSSASFVFSKMSLLASLILGLKFFLTNNQQQGDSKVEIVHVPLKKYGGVGGDWDRETAENKIHASVITDHGYEHEPYRASPYRK